MIIGFMTNVKHFIFCYLVKIHGEKILIFVLTFFLFEFVCQKDCFPIIQNKK
jgi:hypothetical protein